MNEREPMASELTRRTFLSRAVGGMGALLWGASTAKPAVAQLAGDPAAEPWRGVLRPRHYEPKIKRIIHLYMAGGPSQFESFDYKPELAKRHGQPMPESFTKGQPVAQLQGMELKCMAPHFEFRRWGESGQEISVLFPHLGSIADKLCIIRSMQTEQINHDPAHLFMNTGSIIAGRPSMGSWLWYGVGSEATDLPGYVVLISSGGGQDQPISSRQWHSGFLPARFQGVRFQSGEEPVHYIRSPEGVSLPGQRQTIAAIQEMNRLHGTTVVDDQIEARNAQYSLAEAMQSTVPQLADFSSEPDHILRMYGVTRPSGTFASNCLMARRLAERGVRFIQLYHRGWDHHLQIRKGMQAASQLVDQASAALIRDLEQRGMLDETLVLWGGEFGRTPMAQKDGRDHHIRAFSLFLAGGGMKAGMTYGKTDEFGYYPVENPVHVHDLHATMLYQLGINHEKLTYRFQGRDFRLTDVHGHVVRDLLA